MKKFLNNLVDGDPKWILIYSFIFIFNSLLFYLTSDVTNGVLAIIYGIIAIPNLYSWNYQRRQKRNSQ